MITSLANDKVKLARSLAYRKRRMAERRFLVEGIRLLEEAERAGSTPALVFYEPGAVEADARAQSLLARLRSRTPEVYPVSPRVLEAIAQTESSQGVVAVYPLPELPMPPAPGLVLVLDAIRDPGNLGSILRTAWAAAVEAVLLAPGTSDSYNPKVVRAALGAHFHLPLVPCSWSQAAAWLARMPRIYLAEAAGGADYRTVDWSRPLALIIGGEARGAGDAAAGLATARVSIPMPGQVESLNAAVAAGILLFRAAGDGA